MLIRFSVTRKDTGAPVPNARIEVEKAEAPGTTDSQGKVEIVTYWSGNWSYSVTAPGYDLISGTLNNRDIPILDFGVSLLYPAVTQPPPLGNGEERMEAVGTSCHLVHIYFGNISKWVYESDITGERSQQYNGYQDAKDAGARSPRCQQVPSPPPPTAEDLSPRVSTLEGLVNSIQSTISSILSQTAGLRTDLTAAFKEGISSIWTSIDDIILAAEEESKAWRKGILDLEGRMKSWIEDQILEILWRAMSRDTKVK
jgi:hypothetical protein